MNALDLMQLWKLSTFFIGLFMIAIPSYDALFAYQKAHHCWCEYLRFVKKALLDTFRYLFMYVLLAFPYGFMAYNKNLDHVSFALFTICSSIYIMALLLMHDKKKWNDRLVYRGKMLCYRLLFWCMVIPLLFIGIQKLPTYQYGIFIIGLYMLGWPVVICGVLCRTIIQGVYRYFVAWFVKKQGQLQDMDVIGICGAYGKSTVARDMQALLSRKWSGQVVGQPLAYEIHRCVSALDDYMVEEFHMTKRGAYQQQAHIATPNELLLLNGSQDLLCRVGTHEQIRKETQSLIHDLPQTGKVYVNVDEEDYALLDIPCEKITFSMSQSADYQMMDFSYHIEGSRFVVCYQSEMFPFTTKRVGVHACENLLALIAFAHSKGFSMRVCQAFVAALEPISGVLEYKKEQNHLVLDHRNFKDEHGLLELLDVLEHLPMKKCIVLSGVQGFAKHIDECNYQLGKRLALCTDRVILVKNYASEMVLEGLEESGMKKECCIVVHSNKKAYRLAFEVQNQEELIVLVR